MEISSVLVTRIMDSLKSLETQVKELQADVAALQIRMVATDAALDTLGESVAKLIEHNNTLMDKLGFRMP